MTRVYQRASIERVAELEERGYRALGIAAAGQGWTEVLMLRYPPPADDRPDPRDEVGGWGW